VSSIDAPETDDRFEFGENWARFASDLPDSRVRAARDSLAKMLGVESLAGASFLDLGSGSGLFSLAAWELGAERILSLDYDPASVATTAALRRRAGEPDTWEVRRGDALDAGQMEALGTWDVVYSWGVLHHTGDMWRGLEHACARVAPGGHLYIAIYNDQGFASRVWLRVKKTYNRLPRAVRPAFVMLAMLPMELRSLVASLVRLRPGRYFGRWRAKGEYERGMNHWYDLVDWVGGYPFEVAAPERIFEFCAERGFVLRNLRTVGGAHGCNEFVFERPADPPR
jgi:SAM-dependent methyltransferase